MKTSMYPFALILAGFGFALHVLALNELSEKNKQYRGNLFSGKFFITKADFTAKGWRYFLVANLCIILSFIIGVGVVLSE